MLPSGDQARGRPRPSLATDTVGTPAHPGLQASPQGELGLPQPPIMASTPTPSQKQNTPPPGCPPPLHALYPRPWWESAPPSHLPTPDMRTLPRTFPGRSYPQLKLQCKNLLVKEWEDAAPDPARYPYRPSLTPHPFVGLDKFTAGRLHQMRSGKSYFSAHPSGDSDAPTSCPSCDEAPETFEHAMLLCPAKELARSPHLQGVSDIGPEAPVWSSASLLAALARFISSTATAFPSGMFLRPSSASESVSSLSSNVVSFGYFMSSQES